MDPRIVATRLQDMNEGLLSQTGGLVETHYRKSKRLGAAARVCNLIKGQDVITDASILYAAAGEMHISADTLESALRELEEIGWVRVQKVGGDIKKIEETIPLLTDQYIAIGEKWVNSNPGEIEKESLLILDELLASPQRERDIVAKHNLDDEARHIIFDVGKSGTFLNDYTSPVDTSRILFSPLYHDENPDKFIQLLDKYPDEDVIRKIQTLRGYQGTPIDVITDAVLIEAIVTGCLPSPSVQSTAGKRHFAFTPLQGVGKMEKSLLEKARAIVACVRYGEHFAGITKIKYPTLILERLKSNKTIGPHSEIKDQYILLHKLGVGIVARSTGSRYVFHLLDTPENLRALDLAIQYLELSEPSLRGQAPDEARQLLIPGVYGSATRTRMEVKSVRQTKLSSTSASAINHLLIGGSSGTL